MSILLAAAASTLVFCAPGYPGGAGDAQPYVDGFAKAAAAAAGWPAGSLSAIYDPTEQGGLTKLGSADAVLAFVPYPFYVEHAAQLHLTPLAQADVAGTGTKEKWTLVARTGRVTGAASLAGYTIVSVAGYSPQFVLHSALSAWEVPPASKWKPWVKYSAPCGAWRRVNRWWRCSIRLRQQRFRRFRLRTTSKQ